MTDRDILTEARELLDPLRRDIPFWWYVGEDGPGLGWKTLYSVASADSFRAASNDEKVARFIAATPGLVSRLADEVERLRRPESFARMVAETAATTAMLPSEVEQACGLMAERDAYYATIERVLALADALEQSGMEGGHPSPLRMAGLVRDAVAGGDEV